MIDDIKKAEHILIIFSIRQIFPSSCYGLGAFFIYSWREGIFRLVYGGASICHLLSDSECKSQIYLRQK